MSTEEKTQRAAKKIANKACTQFPIVARAREEETDGERKTERERKSSRLSKTETEREDDRVGERDREEGRRRERMKMK